MNLRLKIPEKCEPLLRPARYKVLRGGRGSAKSWTLARLLIFKAIERKRRILCTREFQTSIKESVHELLTAQIQTMGLSELFDVTDHELTCGNGSQFIFFGLHDQTSDSMKSYEGIDIAWVEEAHTLTKKSLNILIPTIRKEDSEIWLSFNPNLDTDEVWQRFIENPPPHTVSIELNYRDNPWFPKVLEDERQHAQRTMTKEEYENIWEGKCKPTMDGAVYTQDVALIVAQGRYAPCPYDPRLKVHTVWDMGWRGMAIGLVQRGLSECRFIGYLEGEGLRTDQWATDYLNPLKLNWGYDWLPPDAFAGSRRSEGNDADILRRCGRKVKSQIESIPRDIPVEARIRASKQLLARSYFNKGGMGIDLLWECLRRYRRHVPVGTQEPTTPMKDRYSHGADMVQYTALVIDKMQNQEDEDVLKPVIRPRRPADMGVGAL